MDQIQLRHLSPQIYEHPFDRKALTALQKMRGLPLLLKKVNEYSLDRIYRFRTTGNGIQLSHQLYPDIHQSLVDACAVLGMSPVPDLFLLRREGFIFTTTFGVQDPFILINYEGFENFSPAEWRCVFGHELGHIKSEHLQYHQVVPLLPFLGQLITMSTFGLGGIATNGLTLAIHQWVVMARLTCDRAGLLACQDLDMAIRVLIKTMGFSDAEITPSLVDQFIAQARAFDSHDFDKLDQLTRSVSFLQDGYVRNWLIFRASELLKWVDSGSFESILDGSFDPQQPPPELDDSDIWDPIDDDENPVEIANSVDVQDDERDDDPENSEGFFDSFDDKDDARKTAKPSTSAGTPVASSKQEDDWTFLDSM